MLVLCNLALCLQSLGQDSQALESVQAALRLQPQAAIPWRVQGDLLRAMNRPGEALASYDQALARVPDDGASLLGSAHAYLALKQPELARPKLTTLLMQAPLQGCNEMKRVICWPSPCWNVSTSSGCRRVKRRCRWSGKQSCC